MIIIVIKVIYASAEIQLRYCEHEMGGHNTALTKKVLSRVPLERGETKPDQPKTGHSDKTEKDLMNHKLWENPYCIVLLRIHFD